MTKTPTELIGERVKSLGSMARAAQTLGVHRATLANYLSGLARPGSQALIEANAKKAGWLRELGAS